MSSRSRSPVAWVGVLVGVLAAFGVPRPVSAIWPVCGRAVSTAPNGQMHSSVTTDGAGGTIIAWEDLRDPRRNIYAQHLLASGEPDGAWPVNGQVLLTDPASLETAIGGQSLPRIVPDGAGGAIVAWLDNRRDAVAAGVFAQHVLAGGAVDPTWPANGAELSPGQGLQHALEMVGDGEGGAIVTWVDGRAGAEQVDIYAQHVKASGTVDSCWPVGGVAVCDAPEVQGFPEIVPDGTGGAIVAWHDDRDRQSFDIYAQHILHSGVVDPCWPGNGRAISAAPGDQSRPTLVADTAHGAIVAWSDTRLPGTSHIFAQHIQATGEIDPGWPADGLAISDAAVTESRPRGAPDGAGGALVVWEGRGSKPSPYLQHVKATGVVDPLWPAAGLALSHVDRPQTNAGIVSDGLGGAVVAWQDSFNVVAQHVLATGELDAAYPDSGRALCELAGKQGEPAIVATDGGGAIVAWTDGRSGTDADIFALQVLEARSSLGVVLPGPGGFRIDAEPNPFPGSTRIFFSVPERFVEVGVFDLQGRLIRHLYPGVSGAGSEVLWDGRSDRGQAVPSGVYFVRVATGTRQGIRRVQLIR